MNKNIYELCFVTDRDFLRDISLEEAIEKSILGGVSMIQLREKNISKEEFINIGKSILQITRKYNIPLIINDNVSVALELDAEGVHLGQGDMNPIEARKILGENKIIGISISSLEEFEKSKNYPVDYYGVGPIYTTNTKKDANPAMGLENLKTLKKLTDKPLLTIGGINVSNVHEIIENNGDGVAIISGILKDENKIYENTVNISKKLRTSFVKKRLDQKIEKLREKNPLIYHLTNTVTINDCANVTLAIGGSPLMSFCLEEMEEIIKISNGIVLNIGTMDKEMRNIILEVGKLANKYEKPIVLDPVGIGATKCRKELIKNLLENVQISVIKGNLAEIKSIINWSGKSKGVDSLDNSLEDEILDLGKEFMKKYNCVLGITGKNDYIFSKEEIIKISNGHEKMSKVTGTGCMTASLIGSFLGSFENDFLSTILGISIMGISGEIASSQCETLGTGSLRVKIIDNISLINSEIFLEKIKIESL